MVCKVKKFESGVVKDLIIVFFDIMVCELVDIIVVNSIFGLLVVDGNDFVGIVIGWDI